MILSAAYALFLYRRIIFGAMVKPSLQAIEDLTAREIAILAPLVVITILMGVYPKPVLDVTTPSVAKLISDNKAALLTDKARGAFARARATTQEVAVIPKGDVQ